MGGVQDGETTWRCRKVALTNIKSKHCKSNIKTTQKEMAIFCKISHVAKPIIHQCGWGGGTRLGARPPRGGQTPRPERPKYLVWLLRVLRMGRWNFPLAEVAGGEGRGGYGAAGTSLVLMMRRYWYWSLSSLVSSSFSLRTLTATTPSLSSVPK